MTCSRKLRSNKILVRAMDRRKAPEEALLLREASRRDCGLPMRRRVADAALAVVLTASLFPSSAFASAGSSEADWQDETASSSQAEYQAVGDEGDASDASNAGDPAAEAGGEASGAESSAANNGEAASAQEDSDGGDGSSNGDGAQLSEIKSTADLGDSFLASTDEGVSLVVTVTSNTTVQVGGGRAGKIMVINDDEAHPTLPRTFKGDLTIPDQVSYGGKSYAVTSIGRGAFSKYYDGDIQGEVSYSIGDLILPETVTTICGSSFSSSSVSQVTYSDAPGLTTLESSAFYGAHVGSFEVPASLQYFGTDVFAGGKYVPSYLGSLTYAEGCKIDTIPSNTFSYCTLGGVQIPSNIKTIEKGAFANSSLSNITIPATVKNLGQGVFANCSSLSSVVIEAGSPLTEIPAQTFSGCAKLSKFNLLPTITSIESSAFAGTGFTEFELPSTITYLGGGAFSNCQSLVKFSFEEGHQLLNLMNSTFSGCEKLSSIELPDNIRSIGGYAFSGCTSLSQIRIPKKCTSLGGFAFQGCTALSTIVFEGDASALESYTSTFYRASALQTVVYYGKRSKTLNVVSSAPTIYYTLSYYGSQADIEDGDPIARFCIAANSVPSSVEPSQVWSGSLQDPPAGKNWVVEDGFSLTGEATDSFYLYGEPIVSELKVGDTFVAYTAEGVPVTYTVLTVAQDGTPGTVMAGTSAGSMGKASAVDVRTTGAINLTSEVTAPDANSYSVVKIAPYAFAGCNRFVSLTIPASVKSIGGHAFFRCSMLRNIRFDSDASQIEDNGIFTSCNNIAQVVFGGKKANLRFGASSPSIYYAVRYYASKHDLQIGNVEATVLVRDRTLLGLLGEGDVLSGAVPELGVGYEWAYENGFAADKPLSDSCYVYADGIGFKYQITVTDGNVAKTDCWFKILTFDEETKTGTVQVGLGKSGITAVHTGVQGVPVIPRTVTDSEGNKYTVTEIGEYAFGSEKYWEACEYLTSVNTTTAITRIADNAFLNCLGLESYSFNNGLLTLGKAAFKGCKNLKQVTLEKATKLQVIPESAFEGDYNLEGITVPAGVKTIEARAVASCYYIDWQWNEYGIKYLDLSRAKGLERVENEAFSGNQLMAGSPNFPQTCTYIGDYAFANCKAMQALVFDPVRRTDSDCDIYVGKRAFAGCSGVTTIRFKGDADRIYLGADAFDFYGGDSEGNSGALKSIVFLGKKKPDIEKYVDAGNRSLGELDNDYGRSYRIYYAIDFYMNESARQAGDRFMQAVVIEDSLGRSEAPGLTNYQMWRCEDGFSLDRGTTNSYYVCAGYNIAYAIVDGVEDSYYYYGSAIKPAPSLTMPFGAQLEEGVDYVYDSSYGLLHDGYANNTRMGTASVHLRGIGDYAGNLAVYFQILPYYDSSSSFTAELASRTFIYDGSPKTPAVEVTGTVKGNSFVAEEGEDYELSYENNVDAGQASVLVSGIGMFSSVKRETFTIQPMSISECKITAMDKPVEQNGSYTVNMQIANPSGTELVLGRDYTYTVYPTFGVLGGTIMVKGQGNYAGGFSVTYGIGGKGGEGTGGGGGKGNGSSHYGSGGSGSNNAVGPGSDSENVNGSNGVSISTNNTGADAASASKVAGGEQGGSSYRFYALDGVDYSFEPDELDDLLLGWYPVLFILAALGLGAIYGYRTWKSQAWWMHRRWKGHGSEAG